MRKIKQDSARNVMVLMVSSSDHVAGVAGATLTLTASKNGGAFAAITPTVTERGSGWYNVALTAAMTDTLGDLVLHVTAGSSDPSDPSFEIVAYDQTDAVSLGLTSLGSVEVGLTMRDALRLVTAAVAGKISGAATTTVTIKNAVADSKNRVVATVDANGNRTSLTYDLTD